MRPICCTITGASPSVGSSSSSRLRAGAQDAADRQHLLLAAGKLGALAPAPLLQVREQLVDLVDATGRRARPAAAACRFSSTSRLEKMPRSSGQNASPEAGDPVRGQIDRLGAIEEHRTFALADDAHDRLQRRGLAGAVAAEQGDDLARGDVEVDAVQDVRFAVPGVQVADRQQRAGLRALSGMARSQDRPR